MPKPKNPTHALPVPTECTSMSMKERHKLLQRQTEEAKQTRNWMNLECPPGQIYVCPAKTPSGKTRAGHCRKKPNKPCHRREGKTRTEVGSCSRTGEYKLNFQERAARRKATMEGTNKLIKAIKERRKSRKAQQRESKKAAKQAAKQQRAAARQAQREERKAARNAARRSKRAASKPKPAAVVPAAAAKPAGCSDQQIVDRVNICFTDHIKPTLDHLAALARQDETLFSTEMGKVQADLAAGVYINKMRDCIQNFLRDNAHCDVTSAKSWADLDNLVDAKTGEYLASLGFGG